MSNFVKRFFVALAGIPIAILIVYIGGHLFAAAVAIISSATLGEFYQMARKKNAFADKYPGIIANIIIIAMVYYLGLNPEFTHSGEILLSLAGIIFLTVLSLELWSKKPNAMLNISATLGGLLYVSVAFIFMLKIREMWHIDWNDINPNSGAGFSLRLRELVSAIDDKWSAWFLMNIFFSIWICDTAAYMFGKKFGRRKLFERISPKKTWEGSIAGFIFAILSFVGFGLWLIPELPLRHAIIIGAIVGSIGQIGDLAESQLKRDAGVKDSSALIPGHGGFLDRFDSAMFVMPAVYIFIYCVFYFS